MCIHEKSKHNPIGNNSIDFEQTNEQSNKKKTNDSEIWRIWSDFLEQSDESKENK